MTKALPWTLFSWVASQKFTKTRGTETKQNYDLLKASPKDWKVYFARTVLAKYEQNTLAFGLYFFIMDGWNSKWSECPMDKALPWPSFSKKNSLVEFIE